MNINFDLVKRPLLYAGAVLLSFGAGMATENSQDLLDGGSYNLDTAPTPCPEVGEIPLPEIPVNDAVARW